MSVWVIAIEAARIAVKTPIAATTSIAWGAEAKMGEARATRYTPALTIVAAWMSADTGVGPSMASGSQTWSGNWALLPTAPAKMRRAMTTTLTARPEPPSTMSWIDARMSRVPVVTKIAMMPRANPTSPTLLTMNAFFAARAALRRRYQKPMRR